MIGKTGFGLLLALILAISAATTAQAFSLVSFDGSWTDLEGHSVTQAGSHPDVTTKITFSTKEGDLGFPVPDGNARDIDVTLPPGLIGNASAMPKCSLAELSPGAGNQARCPVNSQVGTALVTVYYLFGSPARRAIYSLPPRSGAAATFGFNIAGVVVLINARLIKEGGYRVEANAESIAQGLPTGDSEITFWGVPADPAHDPLRSPPGEPENGGATSTVPRRPLMSLPTSCTGTPLETRVQTDSWQDPGVFQGASFDHDIGGNPMTVDGCEAVPFEATIAAQPTSLAAASPSGLSFDLRIPQSENPDGLRTADLRDAVVTLPAGMAVNSSSVSGLGACGPAQVDLDGIAPANCPSDSKIGSLEVETPLLDRPLRGGAYLASQNDNPFGSLLALYLVAEDPQSGVVVKLAGRVDADPVTGRLTTRLTDNPQLPFEALHLELFGGSRASLLTPGQCGTFVTEASFAPWSGTAPVTSTSSFQITSGPNGSRCPNGSFGPKLTAGTVNPIAGDHSPFTLQVSREDGTQQLGSIQASLPKGLVASLKGVPYCSDGALAAISGTEGTGAAQNANPSCPAASQIGTVTVGAGAGPSPFYLSTGKAYLAGPYKGAPMSLAIITPAVAGPFDLGSVVVRSALQVDPTTAKITAVSDPLPTILHGIPLNLRDVRVDVNRRDFTLNPTSCDPMRVDSSIASAWGKTASPFSRFQVAGCERLAFKPSLKLKVTGPTKRGTYPKLRAELKAPAGQANIGKVSVALPHSEFLAQEHIKTICTRVQYAAGGGGGKACPQGSIYGWARAFTPLLDKPLEGPVYLRSSSNPLPDLMASLDGQIHIDLTGRIDSVKGGIRSTFESVPDAPVSKFVLTMKGGKKSLLVNSRNLCAGANRATVKMDGQNGKVHDINPVVGNSCKGKARKGATKRK